jgi:hypothetical protein
MNRRRWLALAWAGATAALAGCTAGYRGDTDTNAPLESTPDPLVPESELVRGASKDGIPAIVDPVFGADWSGISFQARHELGGTYTARPRLADDTRVVGVERAGEARAYPLPVLDWHEVVNDDLSGPLLVTYCPLCGSAVSAVREVNGQETVFGVSGLLYKQDLVLYDALTDSLWSQIEARAIRGPKTGTSLDLVPSSLTTWKTWREEHPDTLVLRPPPESNTVSGRTATRNYDVPPYLGYAYTERIGIGGEYDDDRLHPKAQVVGVAADGVAKAYPLERVVRQGVVNDRVGDHPVVVTAVDDETLVAYDRRVGGRVRRFGRSGGELLAAGTRWDALSGAGLRGRYADVPLESVTDVSQLFFFAWLSFYPETQVYGA